MKASLAIGDTTRTKYTVVKEDVATFQGRIVHRVCSTFALAREAEWCSRQFVLQVKDQHEEGIGTMLTINHTAPAFVGETIAFQAQVEIVKENELICRYHAMVGDRLIASGKTGQKILNKDKIAEIFSKFD